jgi:hypothetical protein
MRPWEVSQRAVGLEEGAVLFFADSATTNGNDFGMSLLNGKLAVGTGNPDTTVAMDSSPSNAAIVLDAVSGTSPSWVVSDAPISN